MFALEKINHLEKGKKQFASFSSKEIFKKAQFREHSLRIISDFIPVENIKTCFEV